MQLHDGGIGQTTGGVGFAVDDLQGRDVVGIFCQKFLEAVNALLGFAQVKARLAYRVRRHDFCSLDFGRA